MLSVICALPAGTPNCAEMTGSGSAVYGIFAYGESAQAALKKFECCDTFAGAYRTAAKGVEMIK